jgi:hypothetical protein
MTFTALDKELCTSVGWLWVYKAITNQMPEKMDPLLRNEETSPFTQKEKTHPFITGAWKTAR